MRLNEYKGDLIVKLHGGIPPDRIANLESLKVIEDLLKCPICLNFLNNPYPFLWYDVVVGIKGIEPLQTKSQNLAYYHYTKPQSKVEILARYY